MIVDHVRWTANLGKIALSIIVLCYLKTMERVIQLVIMQTACLMDLIALSGSLRAGNDKISRHLLTFWSNLLQQDVTRMRSHGLRQLVMASLLQVLNRLVVR